MDGISASSRINLAESRPWALPFACRGLSMKGRRARRMLGHGFHLLAGHRR